MHGSLLHAKIRDMTVSSEAIKILRSAGEAPDDGLDLAETALALAALERQGAELTPYREHLNDLVAQVKNEGLPTKLDDRLCLLRRVLVVQNKYRGEGESGVGWHQSNLMSVIDRRQGSAVALGVIYLHVAEKTGWPMSALGFPGHFFVRLSGTDGRAILDPFRSGQTCPPEELRRLLPVENLDAIERLPDYYAPVSKRDVLLRLQNNIKHRQLGMDQMEAAVNTLQSMILIAPRRQELWRELGYLQAERGNLRSAITALEIVCDLSFATDQAKQAAAMVQQLRRQLN